MKQRLFRPIATGLLSAEVLGVLFVGIWAGVGLWNPVEAGHSFYALEPSRLEVAVSPLTQTASGAIRVLSTLPQPVELQVRGRYWQLSETGGMVYPPEADTHWVVEQLMLNPATFTLQAGTHRLVRFAVKVPDKMPEGEYPLQLFFEPTQRTKDALFSKQPVVRPQGVQPQLEVIPIFTTTVYVLKGTPQATLAPIEPTCAMDLEAAALFVRYETNNTGKRHARLTGSVLISPAEQTGPPIHVVPLNEGHVQLVFPGQKRPYTEAIHTENLPSGEYRATVQLVDERGEHSPLRGSCEFVI